MQCDVAKYSPRSGLVQLFGGANGGGQHPFADSGAWWPPASLTFAFGIMNSTSPSNSVRHIEIPTMACLLLTFASTFGADVGANLSVEP